MDRPGFATGLLTGLGLGIGLSLLIALAFPPFVLDPPSLDPENAVAPPAPGLPMGAGIAGPRTPDRLVESPSEGPVLPVRPAVPPTEAMQSLAPRPAPDVFSGAAGGSPSLVPLGAD